MSNEAQVNVKRANVLFMDGKLEEAFNMYRICAENGDAEAAFDLGFCFLSHGAVSIAGLCSGVGTILLKQPFPTTPFKIYSK